MQNAVEPPPRLAGGWTGAYVINSFIVAWVLVVGFGFGGWASITNFVQQVDTFGLFAKCYQCPPHVAGGAPPLPPAMAMAPAPAMPPAAAAALNATAGGGNGLFPPAPAPSPMMHFFLRHHHHRHHRHGL
jgi:auxin influx carrier (AUX1 LAX family)